MKDSRRSHKHGNDADLVLNVARRAEFERLKKTPGFTAWKREQYRIQGGRCAWCIKPMSSSYKRVHVDHALALYHGGSNAYSNLVLSHADCNIRKWIRIDGVPQWILNAQADRRSKQRLRSLRQVQQRQAEELMQDSIADELRWISGQDSL